MQQNLDRHPELKDLIDVFNPANLMIDSSQSSESYTGIKACFSNKDMGCIKNHITAFISIDKIKEIAQNNQEKLMKFWEKTGQAIALKLLDNLNVILISVLNNMVDYIFFCTTLLYVLVGTDSDDGFAGDLINRYCSKSFGVSKIFSEFYKVLDNVIFLPANLFLLTTIFTYMSIDILGGHCPTL